MIERSDNQPASWAKKFSRKGFYAVPLQRDDFSEIRIWRNNQIDALRQSSPLSEQDQSEYYTNHVQPQYLTEKPNQALLGLFKGDELVAYGGLVHIDWAAGRGELSLLYHIEYDQAAAAYREDLGVFLDIIKELAFQVLKMNRICAETYIIRPPHIKIMEENGFIPEGRLREHVKIQGCFVDSLMHGITKADYDKERPHGENTLRPFSVLVTSASQKISCMLAVKDALFRTFGSYGPDEAKLYAADSNPHYLAKYFSDDFWDMPPLADLTIQDLIAYCHAHNIKAIVPTRDGELEYFAQHKQELSQSAIHVLISDPEAVRTSLDKLEFYETLKKEGYPVIETVQDISLISPTSYVVKEQFGSGSKTILLNAPKKTALVHAKTLNSPIFQPYIEGTEYSVDLYITNTNKAKGAVARERTLVIDGESKVTTTVHDQDIIELCTKASLEIGLYGHSVWQLMKAPDGSLHIIECNSRFGGASSAALAVGLDSFFWFLQEVIHDTVDHIDFVRTPEDIRQIRYPANKFTPVEEL